MTQTEKIEHILNSTCTYFGLDRETISNPKRSDKSTRSIYSKFVIKALIDNTTLPNIGVARILGYKTHGNVSHHYNEMTDNLSGEFYGSDKIRRLYKEYLNYLNLESNDNKTTETNGDQPR